MTGESRGATERAIIALEQARLSAISAHDIEALARLLADDLVHIHATGKVETKQEYLAGVLALPRTSARKSLRVRVYGDAAVLDGIVTNTLQRPGRTESEAVDLQVTLLVHRGSEGWKFVSFHACRRVDTTGT